jgi:cation diffusion facilitator family transporter
VSARDAEDDARNGAIRQVVVITLVLNVAVAAAKGVFGVLSGSIAISSDAVHSLVDAGSNVIGLVTLRLAQAPPDSEHPYGHRKFEIVAAAAIGVAVGIAAVRFAWDAIEALSEGRPPPDTTAVGFAVIVGTWVVNVFVAFYEARRGRQLGSEFLLADASHTASDVVVTGAVFASYLAAHFGVSWADPIGALFVVLIVARVAWQLLARNISVLVDQAVVDPAVVVTVVRAIPGVEGCHRVRSRGSEMAAHVDLHIQIDGEVTLRRAHTLAHQVEDALREAIPNIVDVTVHMEPDDDEDEGL